MHADEREQEMDWDGAGVCLPIRAPMNLPKAGALRRATAPWADDLSESFSTAVFGELRGFWVLVNRPDASGRSG